MSNAFIRSAQSFRTALSDIWNGSNGIKLPGPGIYHYQHQINNEKSRIHLRIDDNDSGILIVNASRIFHLNKTAVLMAFLFLEKYTLEGAVSFLCKTYNLSKNQAALDYTNYCEQMMELIRPDGACPLHDLNIETTAPFSSSPSAPYRMDLALTYRCNNDCHHCYNARSRDFKEISTQEWFQIIDRLWEIGVPHIVFTGGEPTLRSDLPDLIARAQQNGQITGINTNGRRFSDYKFTQQVIQAGLDHIQITLESHESDIHDKMVNNRGAWLQTTKGLRNVLDTELYVMTNTTLLQDNVGSIERTLEFLGEMQVPTVGLNALIYSGHGLTVNKGLPEKDLQPLLELARKKTDQYSQKLIWYTPTQYCHFDPVQLDLGVKGCTAALYNMCIEPNGDILPCQSYYQSLGNILGNKWEEIWHHPLAENIRNRNYAPAGCSNCAFFAECGGGCPLSLENRTVDISPF